MKSLYKNSKHSKRIISILIVLFQLRAMGFISDLHNHKAVKDYHKITKSFSKFLEEEGIDDVQHIYEYFNYAMWNGYFSEDHNLQYSLDRDVYRNNSGMSIMSGNGVCLNFADMLSLVYKEMGYNSSVITCFVDKEKSSIIMIRANDDIERKIDLNNSEISDRMLVNEIRKLWGNHAVTCVEVNDELYFFDPTNFVYLNKTDVDDLSIINGAGKFDLKYLASMNLNNINILKVAKSKNDPGYSEEVLEKEIISINTENLEKFYEEQKQNIKNVSNNSKESSPGSLTTIVYLIISSLIIDFIRKTIIKLNANIKEKEIKYLFPKLKKYFEENDIISEFEILKNYELIEKQLGVKDNFIKDLAIEIIKVLNVLIDNKEFHHIMLKQCLIDLGYSATFIYADKYSNKLIKRNIPLILYTDENSVFYMYDYETEELICKDNKNTLISLDGKYRYEIRQRSNEEINDDTYEVMNEIFIRNKMNDEDTLLNKEDVKTLRRTKRLRY